jgi:16S rRNA (cytosine967-C5)-methyltransferase
MVSQPHPAHNPLHGLRGNAPAVYFRRTMPDPRVLALAVLTRVERDAAFANLALDAELDAAGGLDPRDAALATELSYGVLRRRAQLDRALAPLVQGGLDRLESRVLDALRIGAYQLLFTRVPAHAAVDATVGALHTIGLARAVGLANAVLRRLAREGPPPPPDRLADPRVALEVAGSLPSWLAGALLARLGEEAFELAAAVDRPAATSVRVNRTRTTPDAAAARIAADVPGARVSPGVVEGALRLESTGPVSRLAAFREGWISPQDEAAQAVDLLCAPAPGARVLDACAAPGGKSCHLAELGAGEVVALDVSERKVRRIGSEAARLGLAQVHPLTGDAAQPLPIEGAFDLVLVDAPCTGLGTLRRHPELRWRRSPDDVIRLTAQQAQILDAVAPRVRAGGVLVYSVCSLLEEEGPRQLDAFLARHPEFAPAPIEAKLPGLEDGWRLATWPHRHDVDGFFAARLRRG